MISKLRRNGEESLDLPQEIIEDEILSRLPVKSLLRFRCVSKSWGSLIGSKVFIYKHLRNSRLNPTYWKFIFNCTIPERKQWSTVGFPNNDRWAVCSVVGNCNGLLCILREKYMWSSIFLWNPSTKIFTELPKLRTVARKLGFGWDEESGAYKVFAVVLDPNSAKNLGQVYSSKTNSWTTTENGNLDFYNRNKIGVFVSGNIHWLVQNREYVYIEYLNLKSEVFGAIELPWKPKFGLQLRERRGCLSVVVADGRSNVEVWVMRKYGVKESWVKTTIAYLPLHYASANVADYKREGVKFWPRECDEGYLCVESLVSPLPEQMQVHVSVAEGRARRLNRRRPSRYDT